MNKFVISADVTFSSPNHIFEKSLLWWSMQYDLMCFLLSLSSLSTESSFWLIWNQCRPNKITPLMCIYNKLHNLAGSINPISFVVCFMMNNQMRILLFLSSILLLLTMMHKLSQLLVRANRVALNILSIILSYLISLYLFIFLPLPLILTLFPSLSVSEALSNPDSRAAM